jgi:hypothetical protein
MTFLEMVTRKLAIRSAQRAPCQTAFVKRYEASLDFTFPEKFDLSRHNLLLLESIRSGKDTSVLLYWTSEERSRALEPVVEKALGISCAQVIGEVVEVLTPTMPKWTENPIKWGKWLVSASALFGAFSVIRDHFTELFAPPDVIIFAGNSAATNFHTGEPLDIPLVVRNEARLGQADVHLDDVRLEPMDAKVSASTLEFNISEVPQLQAGQNNVDVHITGKSPTLHDPQPQRYALKVEGSAKEGFFLPTRKATSRPFIVTFWPDRSTEVQVVQIHPNVARVVVTLQSGMSAAGLRGQVTFVSAIPPAAGGIVLMAGATALGAPIVVSDKDGSYAKVQFQTSSLQAFTRYSYGISIGFGRPLTELEWQSLRSSVTVTFG